MIYEVLFINNIFAVTESVIGKPIVDSALREKLIDLYRVATISGDASIAKLYSYCYVELDKSGNFVRFC